MKLDYDKKKKPRKHKGKRPSFNRPPSSTIGIRVGGNYRPRPTSYAPRRVYGHNTEQKHTPKQEKLHWNGKVEVWTEPRRPRQEKIIKYEVDTDKLLRELAKGNKDALNEIAERLERETKSEATEETESPQKKDDSEKSTDESKASEVSPETEPEAREQTSESSEQTETDLQDEDSKSEKTESETDDIEAEPQQENLNDESQEIPQDTEPDPEDSPQEDPLDAPELVYMNPSFWEQLESEMSDELEQLEPEEEFEIPPEESEPTLEEGY